MDTDPLSVGSRALLVLLGQRFLVTILETNPTAIRVSFPSVDFPLENMHVELEFHDESGFLSYEFEVLETPKNVGDGLLLSRPAAPVHTRHRTDWRVPAMFEVAIREQAHPRAIAGRIRNLSAGGMLAETDVALRVGDAVDLRFELPSGREIKTVAEVVSSAATPERTSNAHLFGLRFLGLEPEDAQAVTHYVRFRLRELHAQALDAQRARPTPS
ncbi:MAG TPA: PilZ domain-containing protein [Candidatus Hydrogenedentes bacterium]|nr:PilZ domain-containing protein [Candidatus Hydrogenedentota bacterium]HNT88816.1 PilZ domain-containing protein [Candidatus Hydrogenedentota bacterium]